MPFYKNGVRVSMAFYFADKIGAQIDNNPYGASSIIDLAAKIDIVKLFDKTFPTMSRQVTMESNLVSDYATKTSFVKLTEKTNAVTPTKNWWDANGSFNLKPEIGDFNPTIFGRYGSAYSTILKQGKYYLEVHLDADLPANDASNLAENSYMVIQPAGFNLAYFEEFALGRVAALNLDHASINGTYQANLLDASTHSNINGDSATVGNTGDVYMLAYDTDFNSLGSGRVFFGLNGVWGHPDDSATMIDLNPHNYTSPNDATGPGGKGIELSVWPLFGVRYKDDEWVMSFATNVQDSAGEVIQPLEATIKTGNNCTYSPPPGFIAH